MIAKLAYLTSPAPGRYLLNVQVFGSDDLLRFEIAQCHLANIVVGGASFALRESSKPLKEGAIRATLQQSSDSDTSAPVHNRVPETSTQESADGDGRGQQPA
jgi:hypothetical protein